jgi:hypothetical protein
LLHFRLNDQNPIHALFLLHTAPGKPGCGLLRRIPASASLLVSLAKQKVR